MGIFNKLKDMFFEEVDDEVVINDNRIAQKIDFPSKGNKEEKEQFDEIVEEPEEEKSVIFDDEDFVEDFIPLEETKEHVLYGGANKKEEIKEKKKFEPSPVISPVYGILSKNYRKEDFKSKRDLDHLFVSERKKKITFDSVRQKAYGDLTEELEASMIRPPAKEEKELLYDMTSEIKEPVVETVTVGDAEEYFKDLGLEYNVDYIDTSKEKNTRSERNKSLTSEVEKIALSKSEPESEEKNLYDLIDMMYDNKEE